MKRWKDNRDAISPIFKFSAAVRKVIYTTNAIESLNSTYREPAEKRFSERYGAAESPVSGYLRSYQKMDCYHPELGPGIWRAESHV